jgi:hypothetical protein
MHLDLYINPLPLHALFSITGLLFVNAIYYVWVRNPHQQAIQ